MTDGSGRLLSNFASNFWDCINWPFARKSLLFASTLRSASSRETWAERPPASKERAAMIIYDFITLYFLFLFIIK